MTTSHKSDGVIFTPLPGYEIIKGLEYPDFNVRYGRIDIVRKRGNALVNHILDGFPNKGRRQLIDVKVQHLKLDHTTCMNGWHVDTKPDPDAVHHIFVLGENRTEFLIDGEAVQIPEGHYVTYGNTDKHRGPLVTVPEIRLLIRAVESVMIPAGSKFEDTYGYEYPIGGKTYVRI